MNATWCKKSKQFLVIFWLTENISMEIVSVRMQSNIQLSNEYLRKKKTLTTFKKFEFSVMLNFRDRKSAHKRKRILCGTRVTSTSVNEQLNKKRNIGNRWALLLRRNTSFTTFFSVHIGSHISFLSLFQKQAQQSNFTHSRCVSLFVYTISVCRLC